jgi:hypothetical protein
MLIHEYRYSSAIDYAGGKGLIPVTEVCFFAAD